jgi:hypothetical protein
VISVDDYLYFVDAAIDGMVGIVTELATSSRAASAVGQQGPDGADRVGLGG